MQNLLLSKNFWKNKNVFLTGHTGFKGSWLSIYLNLLGSKITGYALKPESKSLYNIAKLKKIFAKSYINDIRDYSRLKSAIIKSNAEIIFHLAAQPLVTDSYDKPRSTFDINIMGTVNLIDIIKDIKKIKSVIIVTTDKVYDVKKNKVFKETDNIKGNDPYSMSKVCCELVTESYSNSFKSLQEKIICTVRAGNVIGGGDFSKNRLIPDIYRSFNSKKKLIIRNPNHIRPWQHVIEPLSGYIKLAEINYKKKTNKKFQNWNFGPDLKDCKTVKYVVEKFSKNIFIKSKILMTKNKIKETSLLRLNNLKSKKFLKWSPKWTLDDAILKIIDWNKKIKNNNALSVCEKQIEEYMNFKK